MALLLHLQLVKWSYGDFRAANSYAAVERRKHMELRVLLSTETCKASNGELTTAAASVNNGGTNAPDKH